MSAQTPMAEPEPVSTDPGLPSVVARGTVLHGSALRQLGRCLGVAAMAVAAYFLISRYLVQTVEVVGVSMRPTLEESHRYLLNRWIYLVRPPRRGEVVVIRDPADHGLSIKRIVGISGDELELKAGWVYNHGQLFAEPYLGVGVRTFPEVGLAEQRLRCGPREYLVMGDNRGNSTDSRSYGPISDRDVLGLVRP
jgi:signal peptidase I